MLMMKMSNSFVRGSSRNPCSVFLLSRISRAIMQYRHAGSAFANSFPNHTSDKAKHKAGNQQNRRNPHRHICIKGSCIFSAVSFSQHYHIAFTVQENGSKVAKHPDAEHAAGKNCTLCTFVVRLFQDHVGQQAANETSYHSKIAVAEEHHD